MALSTDAKCYLIVDTHIVLQQADFLEHPSVTDVIVLSTVFQEIRHKNTGVFLRLKQMLASTTKHFYYFSNEHCKVCVATKVSRTSAPPRVGWVCIASCGGQWCCVQHH